MDYKELLIDYCGGCELTIEWKQKYDYPNLNYFGRLLVAEGRYWHAKCLQIAHRVKNGGVRLDFATGEWVVDKDSVQNTLS